MNVVKSDGCRFERLQPPFIPSARLNIRLRNAPPIANDQAEPNNVRFYPVPCALRERSCFLPACAGIDPFRCTTLPPTVFARQSGDGSISGMARQVERKGRRVVSGNFSAIRRAGQWKILCATSSCVANATVPPHMASAGWRFAIRTHAIIGPAPHIHVARWAPSLNCRHACRPYMTGMIISHPGAPAGRWH